MYVYEINNKTNIFLLADFQKKRKKIKNEEKYTHIYAKCINK